MYLTSVPFLFFTALASSSVFARSIDGATTRLADEITKIGFSVGLIGLAWGAICLVMGRQDAQAKITSALIGIFLLGVSVTVVNLLKSVT